MLIKRDFLENVRLEIFSATGYVFLMELKFALASHKIKIKEIPILFINREKGKSKLTFSIIKEGIILPIKLRLSGSEKYRKKFDFHASPTLNLCDMESTVNE